MEALRLPAVSRKLGVGKSTVWKLLKTDETFPKPFKLLPGVTVWDEADLDRWLFTKKQGDGHESE